MASFRVSHHKQVKLILKAISLLSPPGGHSPLVKVAAASIALTAATAARRATHQLSAIPLWEKAGEVAAVEFPARQSLISFLGGVLLCYELVIRHGSGPPHILRLRPFLSCYDLEGYCVAFFDLIQAARCMDENILTSAVGCDEAKPLGLVEKLHSALLHFQLLLMCLNSPPEQRE